MRQIRRIVYRCGQIVFGIFFMGALYLLFAFVFGLWSVNNDFNAERGTVEIFLISNGAHASVALPVRTEQKDWTEVFKPENAQNPAFAKTQPYVLVGWGSRTFYTEVPRWKDLRPKTAFRALLFDRSALNTTYINTPEPNPYTHSIKLTEAQYRSLIKGIEQELLRDKNGQLQQINLRQQPPEVPDEEEASVTDGGKRIDQRSTNIFYEAKGTYTPWRTCNQWTRNLLSEAQVSVPVWSPFAQTLFWHLK